MTQFSRIMIDSRHRHARWVLMSLERLHAVVARATDTGGPDAPRALWRLDRSSRNGISRLYVVSEAVPDLAVLSEELGVAAQDVATCAYEPFLSKLECGQQWGFRLQANPTQSQSAGVRGVRGKRAGLVRQQDQLEWLRRKAQESGFHLTINRLEDPEVRISESGKVKFARRGSTVTFVSATFDGVLAIDDPDLVRGALLNGIGRAKGYGFGLLTLVPLTDGQQRN